MKLITWNLFKTRHIGIGFSFKRNETTTTHYVANNSAIFLLKQDSYILEIYCASGTVTAMLDELPLITPNSYAPFSGLALSTYEQGKWNLGGEGGGEISLQSSFSGGVFTCRMPDENGVVLDTSVGLYLEDYNKNSEW